MPPIGRSLGRGLLTVASSPVLLLVALMAPPVVWLVVLASGYEGPPAPLVYALAVPPISTVFDLGAGSSAVGLGPSFLVFIAVALPLRAVAYGLLAGIIVETLETGRVSAHGLRRSASAISTVLVIEVLSFSLIVAGQMVVPLLGPGIGLLAQVAALVGGVFFLGFAPTAAIRQGRRIPDTIRRSGRAALLPGSQHLLFCSIYTFFAVFVVSPLAPGGTEITANPTLRSWVFVLVVSVLHLGFMAALSYRWIVAEPSVPEEPVRRRQPARQPAARARGRR